MREEKSLEDSDKENLKVKSDHRLVEPPDTIYSWVGDGTPARSRHTESYSYDKYDDFEAHYTLCRKDKNDMGTPAHISN